MHRRSFVVVSVRAFVGVSTALVMGRQGHEPFKRLALAIAFGPLVLPIAMYAVRHDRAGVFERLPSGHRGTGTVDALVGMDGSQEANDALRSAIDLLEDRLGGLTPATVVDYDTAARSRLAQENQRARYALVPTASATGGGRSSSFCPAPHRRASKACGRAGLRWEGWDFLVRWADNGHVSLVYPGS